MTSTLAHGRSSAGAMKLRNLREIASARVIRHVMLIAQPDGGFEMEIDTGARRVRLEKARTRAPRQFQSVDGALATLAELGVTRVELDLTHYNG